MSVFMNYRDDAYPYRFHGQILVGKIMGGTPSDPKVAEGWLRTKLLKDGNEVVLQEAVAKVMLERGTGDANEAIEAVSDLKHLNGFKRDENGLYIEGRQLKAALKEAASVALAAGKLSARGWGKTNKGLLGFFSEHVFVVEHELYLGVDKPDGVEQRFVHTWRGTGIQYEEFVLNARIDFTVISDHDFSEKEWATIWLCGEMQGIGASRSQSFGTYEIVKWEQIGAPVKTKVVASK